MHSCTHCDAQFAKWAGRCTQCQKWGTITEGDSGSPTKKPATSAKAAEVIGFGDVKNTDASRTGTGIGELDRVLSGGVVPGQVILLSGEPGIGKSTLLCHVASLCKGTSLYVAGEESPSQLKLRFDRLGADTKRVSLTTATDVESVVSAMVKSKPGLVIVDSIQSITTREHDASAGSPTHLRAATAQFAAAAKTHNIPVVLVGQITKDGSVAGPKMLEHMVDTVLHFTGDPRHAYRLLRASKHRFGNTDEVGVFEMTENGLIGVESPTELFLGEQSNAPGTAITCVIEGARAFLVEIQALVNPSSYGTPVRRGSGFQTNRLQMLLAILEKHGKISYSGMDVYVNVVGGMHVKEPAVDLAVCAALISSQLDASIPDKTVLFGEVGLGGEVRKVRMSERRAKESKRLGLGNILSDKEVKTIRDLVARFPRRSSKTTYQPTKTMSHI